MATVDKTRRPSALPEVLSSSSLPWVLTVAAIAVSLAALLPLIQSSGATTTNGRLQRLQQELSDWEARSQALEVEIATLGGLERIENEAVGRFKMVPAQQTIYLQVDEPGPEPRKLPSRFLPQAEPSRQSDSPSVWEKLFGWLPWP